MLKEITIDTALQSLDIIADDNFQYNTDGQLSVISEKSVHLPNHYARYFSLYSWNPCVQVSDSVFVMTRNEFLILALAFANIKQHDYGFEPIAIPLTELCKIFGLKLSGSTDYKAWAKTIYRLSSRRVIYVENQKSIVMCPYFSTCVLDFETKIVTLKLNPDLSQYFLHLEKNKTIFNFGFLRQMSSVSSMLLYILCASTKKGDYTLYNTLDHLKKRLGYSGANKFFIADVLIPAIYEINQISDLNVKIQFIRRNRAITAVRFFVSCKSAIEMEEKGISSSNIKRQKLSAPITEMRSAVVDQDCELPVNPRKEITID